MKGWLLGEYWHPIKHGVLIHQKYCGQLTTWGVALGDIAIA